MVELKRRSPNGLIWISSLMYSEWVSGRADQYLIWWMDKLLTTE